MLLQKCSSDGWMTLETPSVHIFPTSELGGSFSLLWHSLVHLLHCYFCHFQCEQPSATQWKSYRREGLQMCTIPIFIATLCSLYDGRVLKHLWVRPFRTGLNPFALPCGWTSHKLVIFQHNPVRTFLKKLQVCSHPGTFATMLCNLVVLMVICLKRLNLIHGIQGNYFSSSPCGWMDELWAKTEMLNKWTQWHNCLHVL